MRRNYDAEVSAAIAELTGLTDCDLLAATVGAVYATVFLGTFPAKDTLADYIGTTVGRLDKLLRQATKQAEELGSPFQKWMDDEMPAVHLSMAEYIYPLATEMINRGLFFGVGEESNDRLIARSFLKAFCPAQTIKCKELFVGYNIVLEYLWQIVQGTEEDVDSFMEVRYKYVPRAYVRVERFCMLLASLNEHLWHSGESYEEICSYLAKGACEARDRAVANGSARTTKARVHLMVTLDHEKVEVIGRHTNRMLETVLD